MEVVENEKTCSRCGENKPLSEFHNNKARQYGKQAYCKAYRVVYVKQHYEANKESYVARSKVCNERF